MNTIDMLREAGAKAARRLTLMWRPQDGGDVQPCAERLSDILRRSENIVFFGGAGVSTESGIPDFRSDSGLARSMQQGGLTLEQLLSRHFFLQNPEVFYKHFRRSLVHLDARPNAAHVALQKLEQMGKIRAIITQNIDSLHQAAGSLVVHELHGSGARYYCMSCGQQYGVDLIVSCDGIPVCAVCGGMVRPDVVLYEEPLDEDVMRAAEQAISAADTLIIGGTSLVVYPAAGLIQHFGGSALVLINRTETPYDAQADLVIREPIGEVLREAVEGLLT